MRLDEIYLQKKPVFSFEFFPPKTEKGEENLLKAVCALKQLDPGFFSITYGAGGSTRGKTIELGAKIRRLSGIETVCHVTCVSQSRDEVRAIIDEIGELGMENIMALRGDPPEGNIAWSPHPDGFHYASELVSEIHKKRKLSVAVAGFPEMHPDSKSLEDDLKYLKLKIDSGADVVITQLFLDNEDFYNFDRRLKAMGITVPIVPGVLPFLSAEQLRRFTNLCKSRIPEALDRELSQVEGDKEAGRQLGVDYATKQLQGLLDYGVPGVHVYALNQSSSSLAIFKNLRLI